MAPTATATTATFFALMISCGPTSASTAPVAASMPVAAATAMAACEGANLLGHTLLRREVVASALLEGAKGVDRERVPILDERRNLMHPLHAQPNTARRAAAPTALGR